LPIRHRINKINLLGVIFYNIFLLLFKGIIPIAALFNPKAKKWVLGRKNIFDRLAKATEGNQGIIWIHCASLGEFEQGRPLLEKLRAHQSYKNAKFLLTFFSPSGYEIRKDYKGADWVFYLPMDGPKNAKRFLEIVNPSLVIFVKYEFWYYYLKKIKYRNIPLILVSALFWKEMSFFKWYGAMQRKMLSRFDHLFVQDKTSKQLLDDIGLSSITSISGDTRFDRVIDIAESAEPLPLIEQFIQSNKTIIAGSTWPEDEAVLKQTLDLINDPTLKLIMAPHEISEKHLASIEELFPGSIRYSQLAGSTAKPNVLIIDNIGLLSRLYKYATITYIGGGFGKGIHNTLEAAVYFKPVVFGPVFHKFKEAADLIRNGGAFTISNTDESVRIISQLLTDKEKQNESGKQSGDYVYSNRGASQRIIQYLQEKKLT
jgi:3-deoxy-D-manno-octulosonic-acid transferase